MAKIRLSDVSRRRLIGEAKTFVERFYPTKEIDALRERLSDPVRACVEHKFPVKDMAVCRKYHVGKTEDLIKIISLTGSVTRFSFLYQTGPYVIGGRYAGRIYAAPARLVQQVERLHDLETARAGEINLRMKDYTALINGAKIFDEVCAVWPEAEKLAGEMVELACDPDPRGS